MELLTSFPSTLPNLYPSVSLTTTKHLLHLHILSSFSSLRVILDFLLCQCLHSVLQYILWSKWLKYCLHLGLSLQHLSFWIDLSYWVPKDTVKITQNNVYESSLNTLNKLYNCKVIFKVKYQLRKVATELWFFSKFKHLHFDEWFEKQSITYYLLNLYDSD